VDILTEQNFLPFHLGGVNQRSGRMTRPVVSLNFPFAYLMILSRLQAIDQNLYEAAEIDGAAGRHKFLYITLPEVYFVVNAIILLRVIWNFNKFEEVYLLTSNVKVLSVYTYLKAFTGAMDLGQGATLAVLQFILLIGFILFYVKRVIKW